MKIKFKLTLEMNYATLKKNLVSNFRMTKKLFMREGVKITACV